MTSSSAKTEEELLDEIKEVDQEREKFREEIRRLQAKLAEAESDLIEVNIRGDRLKEALRVHRKTTVKVFVSDREREIDAFRQRLPGLMKKIEGEKKLF